MLGLGHIGASLASALSTRGWKVWGWDRDAASVRYARKEGWLYHVARPDMEIDTHNLICVIALPESAVGDPKLSKMLSHLPSGTIVTEVFSSKGKGTVVLERECAALGLRFGWSHPLAGREGNGVASADPGIFAGATVLVDALAPAAVRADLARLWKGIGCSVELMSTEHHQRHMAAGSHLMHALAYSLMHALGGPKSASPSVLSTTRVAKSSPEAWAVILASNSEEVTASIERLRKELGKVSRLVHKGDGRSLFKYLAEGQRLRLKLEEKK
ncbi:MAG: prephenate dehydrogenase [Deltaproteobacteria bacterium]|nr:prephenate dehydrogenase [Deltaproteobacteria bacterium]